MAADRRPFDLTGRVAVVTGMSSGIGRAVGALLAAAGADVAGLDVDGGENAEAAQADVRAAGRRGLHVQADVSDADQVERAAERIEDELGPIDIWVNNAARLLVRDFLSMSADDWHGSLATNLYGYINGCRTAAARMVPRRYGRIVNVSSVTRLQPPANLTAYVTAKGGVVGLTQALAVELGPDGVTVNAVAPGATDTPLNRQAWTPAVREAYERRTPVRRIASPEDIASTVVYFASTEASYVTGQELVVDGGLAIDGTVGHATAEAHE